MIDSVVRHLCSPPNTTDKEKSLEFVNLWICYSFYKHLQVLTMSKDLLTRCQLSVLEKYIRKVLEDAGQPTA
jgi:hypothetical protein